MSARSRLARVALSAGVLACLPGAAHAEPPLDEEVLAALERWRDDPLDLRRATTAELALLPWLDLPMAEAIVGLRDAGALRTVADLAQVPNLDAETIAAISPFVMLAPAHERAQLALRVDASGRQERSPGWGAALRVGRAGVLLEGRVRTAVAGLPPTVRGAIGWDQGTRRWTAGAFRPRFGLGLLAGDPAGRSRTGAVAVAEAFDLVPYRDGGAPPRWVGAGVVGSAGSSTRWMLAAGQGEDRVHRRLVAAWERGLDSSGAGAAVVRRGAAHDVSAWGEWRSTAGRGRVELARLAAGSVRAAGVIRMRGQRWRLGAGLTMDDRGGGDGEEPITGQALDRPSAVLQLDGARRIDGWALEGLWRQLSRGAPAARTSRERAQLAAQGPAGGGLWRLWARVDVEHAADHPSDPGIPALQVGCRWRDRAEADDPGLRRELSVRREWTAAGGSITLASAVLGRDGGGLTRAGWRVGIASCSGSRSALWVVAVPGLGIDSAWIAAGGVRLLAAMSLECGRARAAVDAAVQGAPDSSPKAEIQFRLEVTSLR